MRELDPGASITLSSVGVGERFNRSPLWARRLLKQWWDEQQAGGEVRVFRRQRRDGRWSFYTTLAVLQRTLPTARDMPLVRKVDELERSLESAMRRIGQLTDRVERLERRGPLRG